MKFGQKGVMNIDFAETYDQEDDTYYVTFKTGEPSYCIEIDDIILLEVGIFTKLPTGFRILNFTKNRVKEVNFASILNRAIERTLKRDQPTLAQRKAVGARALERVLA